MAISQPDGLVINHGLLSGASFGVAYDGFSDAVLDTAAYSTGVRLGGAWDGEDLLTVTFGVPLVAKHFGFGPLVDTAFVTLGYDASPYGIDWDGTNLVSTGRANGNAYQHVGFSATINDTLAIGDATISDCSWNSKTGNFSATIDSASTSTINLYQGFSIVLLDTMIHGQALTFYIAHGDDGTNYYQAGLTVGVSHIATKYVGFTSVIDDQFVPPATYGLVQGCFWYPPVETSGTRRERASKAHYRSTMRRRH